MEAPALELAVPFQQLRVPEAKGGGPPRDPLPFLRHPGRRRQNLTEGLHEKNSHVRKKELNMLFNNNRLYLK
jgi:hypothetical protein